MSACQSIDPALPRGDASYQVIAPFRPEQPREGYRLGPLDILTVNVFQEPDLSFPQIPIDASGSLSFPLVGDIHAAGMTAPGLARELAVRLGRRYLTDPQVTVTVASSTSQRVTVEGNVAEPGVYDLTGPSSLLQAIARARSTTRTARLNEVIIFRTINGTRMGAVFNLADIRAGRAPDPEIQGGDVVVVGFSFVKGAFRDFLTTAPLFNAFRAF